MAKLKRVEIPQFYDVTATKTRLICRYTFKGYLITFQKQSNDRCCLSDNKYIEINLN
jgi:hypothetical protein